MSLARLWLRWSNASILDSAKKSGKSDRDMMSDPHLKSIATAMELIPVKQYFCRALAPTFGRFQAKSVFLYEWRRNTDRIEFIGISQV